MLPLIRAVPRELSKTMVVAYVGSNAQALFYLSIAYLQGVLRDGMQVVL